jgi:hypothetical protein
VSVPATTGVLTISDARLRAMAALAPATDTDPNVQSRVDAVSPPALIVLWGDPWLEPASSGGMRRACTFTARLSILAVAGQLDAGAGVETLEQLVTYTIARLSADSYSWPLPSVGWPYRQPIGNVMYLAAELRYRPTVYTEGA